jgi:hypothetical protein
MSNSKRVMPTRIKPRQVWAIIACAVVAAVLVGYSAVQKTFSRIVQDGTVNRLVGRKTAVILEADSGYLPLSWSGMSVRSDGLLVRGKPPRSLTEMRASDLRASCSLQDLWKRKWTIKQLQVAQLQTAFGTAAVSQLPPILSKEPPLEPQIDTETPLKLEILETIISRMTIAWGATPETVGYFRDVESRFYPKDHNLDCFARGGTFGQAGWPQLAVDELKLHYRKPKLMVESAVFSIVRQKNIKINGELDFGQTGGMDLRIQGVQVPAEPFLTGFWKGKLEGVYDGECRLQKQFQPNAKVAAVGELHFTRGLVHDVATLNQLALLTRHPQFEKPKIDVLKAHYTFNGSRLDVAAVEIETKGLFRIEGDFALEKGNIDGKFRIGVAPDVADSIPGAREKVFLDERGGYLWTSMMLEGPMQHPKENLKQRLVSAAQEHFAKGIFSSIFKPGKAVLEQLDSLYK